MSSCDVMDGGLSLMLDPVFWVAAAGYTAWVSISHVCKSAVDAACDFTKNASDFIRNNFFKKNDTNVNDVVRDDPQLENTFSLNRSSH